MVIGLLSIVRVAVDGHAGAPVHSGPVTGRVFRRSLDPDLPVAVEARDATIRDAAGREYLDAAGGAIVVNVGHGRASIARVLGEQTARLAYAHGSAFTTEPIEAYAAEIGPLLPVDDPAIYPVSGGSEAIETALKLGPCVPPGSRPDRPLDRHLALGQLPRQRARRARPVGPAAAPPAVRGLAGPVPARVDALPVPRRRARRPRARDRAGARGRARADDRGGGPDTVAAFVAEPIVGATLAAAVPPDDYWPLVAEVCRRHGVLLIADEVMTGFGRTGRWFGLDHWGVRPDILVAAKGATGGYWPFGFVAASGAIHDAVMGAGGFVHGFTYSHAPGGAAVAREVLRILDDEDLVEASRVKGERLADLLHERLAPHPPPRRDPRAGPDGRPRAGRRPRDAAPFPAGAR